MRGSFDRAGHRQFAWCLYDWASSGFVTSIMVALFPPFFRSLVTTAGGTAAEATAYWGYTTAAALALIAFGSPLWGALADARRGARGDLARFAGLGIAATLAAVTIGSGQWRYAALLFVLANIGFAGANVHYESLLPHIAPRSEIDRVSTRGYALGYLGGGMLLLAHLWIVSDPGAFGLPSVRAALNVAFISVAAWWALFSLPLLSAWPLPPPASTPDAPIPGAFPLRALTISLRRLRATLGAARREPRVWYFLLAYWCYNDGIGTIVKMATAYGDEIGLGLPPMLRALVLTQVVGIPATLGMGRLARHIGTRRTILIGLGLYAGLTASAYFMRTAAHFYLLAGGIGLVQGGTQALSRSLFARLIARPRSGEWFGFYSTSGRMAGMAGPLLFGLVTQLAGGGRYGILIVLAFFIAGATLLARLPLDEAPSSPGAPRPATR